MKITTFNNAPYIHSYDTPSSHETFQSLQDRCLSKVQELLNATTENNLETRKSLSSLAAHPIKEKLQYLILNRQNFPHTLQQYDQIAKSGIRFVLIGEDSLFSLQAFCVAYRWLQSLCIKPQYNHFCLVDSKSPYHKDKPFFAPAVIVKMVDKTFSSSSFRKEDPRNKADLYEKLVSFFCTLEIERLIDLMVANHSTELNDDFPRAWIILRTFLPYAEKERDRHEGLLKEWLLKESSMSLAQKLDRLTGGYSVKFYDIHLSRILGELIPGIHIHVDASESLDIWVEKNPEKITLLKGVPATKLSLSCKITSEQLKSIISPALKEVVTSQFDPLTNETLALLKSLPLEKIELRGNGDELLDYLSPTVTSLTVTKVSRVGLEKMQNHRLKELTILESENLQDQDLSLLKHMPLESLALGVMNTTHAAMQKLDSSRLRKLHLVGKRVYGKPSGSLGDGLVWLQECPVESITLFDVQLSNLAIKAMAEMPKLETITLYSCTMRRKHLDLLMQSKSLKVLWLERVPISKEQEQQFNANGIKVHGNPLPPNDSKTDQYLDYVENAVETLINRFSTALTSL